MINDRYTQKDFEEDKRRKKLGLKTIGERMEHEDMMKKREEDQERKRSRGRP
jgi:hypothetical protein